MISSRFLWFLQWKDANLQLPIDNAKNNQNKHYHNKNYDNFDTLTFHFQKPHKSEKNHLLLINNYITFNLYANVCMELCINSFPKAKNPKIMPSFWLWFWNAQSHEADNLEWKNISLFVCYLYPKEKKVFLCLLIN